MDTFGVHSEAGQLRAVLVCRPGVAQERPIDGAAANTVNADGSVQVERLRKEHDELVGKIRERGVDVLELHDLLAETLAETDARTWLLDRCVTNNDVGIGLAPVFRAWLDALPLPVLADHLIGGVSLSDLPVSARTSLMTAALGAAEFILPPLPWMMCTRSASSWIGAGVTLNPLSSPGRQAETRLHRTVYKFHPSFKNGNFTIWWGDSDEAFGASTIDGADVIVVGKGVVLVGITDTTTRQAVFQIVDALFKHYAATRVICCLMPKTDPVTHLDAVLTFCDRDLCVAARKVVDQIRCYTAWPTETGGTVVREDEGPLLDVVRDALGLDKLRVVDTGGAARKTERKRSDDGNSVVALSPGVVIGPERHQTSARLRDEGIEVIAIHDDELARASGGLGRLICPIARDPAY
jgi:arginine deiminase